jgi:hypothetical protein
MIPDVASMLAGIARSVMLAGAAEEQSPYRAFSDQLLSALLMMIAQEFDRAAARLVEENDALMALFEQAQEAVRDDTLRSMLREVATVTTTSLLVSALRDRNRRLRDVLIRLHAHVENREDPAGRALDQRIWSELEASTRRRQLDLANG